MSRTTLFQILGFVGVIALYILLGFLLWRFLDWYIDPGNAKEPSTAKKDLFQALGFILAGTAGVVGIYFTWRNLSISQATLQSTREAQVLEREGQALERFGRAVELLGAADDEGQPTIESRTAGIYTLEGIAKGSPSQFAVITDILNSYIRNNAPKLPSLEEAPPTPLNRRGPDIQVAVNALANLNALRQGPDRGTQIDLRETNLQGVELIGAFLADATLRRADLRGAFLCEPTSKEPTSKEPTSKEPTSRERTSRERTSRERTSLRSSWKRQRPETSTLSSLPTSSALRTGMGRPTNRSRRTEPHSRTSENSLYETV
jgi:hypothetical protein